MKLVFTNYFCIVTHNADDIGSAAVLPVESRQMSIKIAQNDSTRKWKILTPLQKLPKIWVIWVK